MALGNAFGSVSDTDKDAIDAGRDAITGALMDQAAAAVAATAPSAPGGFAAPSGSTGAFGFTGSADSSGRGAYGTPDYGAGQQPGNAPGGFNMGGFNPGWSGGNIPSDVDMTTQGWAQGAITPMGAPTPTADQLFGPPGSPLADQVFGPSPYTAPPNAPTPEAPADFNPSASFDLGSLADPGSDNDGDSEGGGDNDGGGSVG